MIIKALGVLVNVLIVVFRQQKRPTNVSLLWWSTSKKVHPTLLKRYVDGGIYSGMTTLSISAVGSFSGDPLPLKVTASTNIDEITIPKFCWVINNR